MIAEAFPYSLKYSVAIERASVGLAQAHPITLPHWTTGKNLLSQQVLAVGTAKCVHMAEYWPNPQSKNQIVQCGHSNSKLNLQTNVYSLRVYHERVTPCMCLSACI